MKNSFSDVIVNGVLAFHRIEQGLAVRKIEEILPSCRNFKIGKTGEPVEDRWNQPDYRDAYKHKKVVYSSKHRKNVDEMEAYLINKYRHHLSNCDNEKGGNESINDEMVQNAPKYYVYVVWNTL